MLYIHQLNQLTVKSAELESVYLIRELKQKTPYPLREEQLQNYFAYFFISDTDKNVTEQALPLVQPTLEAVEALLAENNPLHEAINLQRAVQLLKELPLPIKNNILYFEEIAEWQKTSFIPEVTSLLNAIPKLRSQEEKQLHNQRLNEPFERVLRNQ